MNLPVGAILDDSTLLINKEKVELALKETLFNMTYKVDYQLKDFSISS